LPSLGEEVYEDPIPALRHNGWPHPPRGPSTMPNAARRADGRYYSWGHPPSSLTVPLYRPPGIHRRASLDPRIPRATSGGPKDIENRTALTPWPKPRLERHPCLVPLPSVISYGPSRSAGRWRICELRQIWSGAGPANIFHRRPPDLGLAPPALAEPRRPKMSIWAAISREQLEREWGASGQIGGGLKIESLAA